MLETTETSAPVSRMSVPTVEPERKEMLDKAQVEEGAGEEAWAGKSRDDRFGVT
jgi:hypothetical protein